MNDDWVREILQTRPKIELPFEEENLALKHSLQQSKELYTRMARQCTDAGAQSYYSQLRNQGVELLERIHSAERKEQSLAEQGPPSKRRR